VQVGLTRSGNCSRLFHAFVSSLQHRASFVQESATGLCQADRFAVRLSRRKPSSSSDRESDDLTAVERREVSAPRARRSRPRRRQQSSEDAAVPQPLPHYLLGILRQQTSSFTMAWCSADRCSEKRKEPMSRTIRAIERHMIPRSRTQPVQTGERKLVAQWQRGAEIFRAHAAKTAFSLRANAIPRARQPSAINSL